MKAFLLDLLDWIVTPYSLGLHMEACRQERERRPMKVCPQCSGNGYVDA